MTDDLLSTNGMIAAEDLYYMLEHVKNIRLLDATYSVPTGAMSPEQAFLGRHIEGAQLFDIDAIADQDAPLPHTVPGAEYFAASVSVMGIGNDDHVVIYDQSGAYMASSRAWWLFRLFGHEKVYVLEGGLQSWISKGFPVVSGPEKKWDKQDYVPRFRKELLSTKDDLLANLKDKQVTVVDARPAARFSGQMPEPRPGMRAGHIPDSVNLPFGDLIERGTGNLREPAELEKIFREAGLSPGSTLSVSCGSGVTACTVALALYKARGQEAAIYDGSWTEWGAENSQTPVAQNA